MATQTMTETDRQRAIDEFMAAGRGTRLEYQGKPQYLIEWEQRKDRKRTLNMTTDKARRGKGAPSRLFVRGAGCI